MAAIRIRNFNIYYEELGKGFPLIFVHGLGGDSRDWAFQLPAFRRYRVFALDLRGHGRSEAPKGAYTLDSFTEDVAEFIKRFGISKCYYVGLSMGGMIGQNLAIKHPELLEALVLADTSPTPGMHGRKGYEEAVRMFEASAKIAETKGRGPLVKATIPMLFTSGFIEKNPEVVENVKKLIAEGQTFGYVNAIRQIFLTNLDIYPQLPSIKIPTLIIIGRQDILTPLVESEKLHKAIENSTLEIIENCGHVSNIEQHEQFNRILNRFLKKMDSRRYRPPKVILSPP